MSAIRTYYIYCDSCGDECDASSPQLSEVRRLARADGWKRRRTKDWGGPVPGAAPLPLVADVCPECEAYKAGVR